MEMLPNQTLNTADNRTDTLKRSTNWMGTGARRSIEGVNMWVKEPDDKKKSRARLGWLGAGVVGVVLYVIDQPLQAILVIPAGALILFAVMAMFGDVLLKTKASEPEKSPAETRMTDPDPVPEPSETEAPGQPSPGPVVDLEKHPEDPMPEFLEEVLEEASEEPQEPPQELPEAETAEESEEPVTAPPAEPLEEGPAVRLEDTPTVRLRVPEERAVVSLEKAEQPQLWPEATAPLGGQIRLAGERQWAATEEGC
ncbi:hypothetical protein [Streptomyces sp. 5-10]|uniref:hypothetical protein n=1 Tax=Streptomyces sp. 5-10 TaxID=878925 RepID=UPI00168C0069|nr:hypothetical protein [Streptomyces sp. 5-10]MBD3004821.1 hypothetical protein [Streptomyces sp. 5-10]